MQRGPLVIYGKENGSIVQGLKPWVGLNRSEFTSLALMHLAGDSGLKMKIKLEIALKVGAQA